LAASTGLCGCGGTDDGGASSEEQRISPEDRATLTNQVRTGLDSVGPDPKNARGNIPSSLQGISEWQITSTDDANTSVVYGVTSGGEKSLAVVLVRIDGDNQRSVKHIEGLSGRPFNADEVWIALAADTQRAVAAAGGALLTQQLISHDCTNYDKAEGGSHYWDSSKNSCQLVPGSWTSAKKWLVTIVVLIVVAAAVGG
jgi:hypothetical protein